MKKYGVIKHWTLSADFAIDMSNELRISPSFFPILPWFPLKTFIPSPSKRHFFHEKPPFFPVISQAAQGLVWLSDSPDVRQVPDGQWWSGPARLFPADVPWRNEAMAQQLWEKSEELVKPFLAWRFFLGDLIESSWIFMDFFNVVGTCWYILTHPPVSSNMALN